MSKTHEKQGQYNKMFRKRHDTASITVNFHRADAYEAEIYKKLKTQKEKPMREIILSALEKYFADNA